jgi:predicted dienelactone hydrolase
MIWERANDLREILNWVETPSIEGLSLDPSKIAVAGFSLGGHSALALSGLQVSKEKFIDYCDRNTGRWDCGWLERGGVNFNEIDAALYNASYYDERVRATIAIDPALSAAATMDSANRMSHPLLTINFVPNEGVPEALDAREITQAVPSGRHVSIPQSWHFSFLPECSLLGKVAIGIGGEENICSDWKHRDRSEVHQLVIKQIIPFLNDSLN